MINYYINLDNDNVSFFHRTVHRAIDGHLAGSALKLSLAILYEIEIFSPTFHN